MPADCGVTALEVVKIVLPSVMVVLGWVVVFKLQKKATSRQETRKDLRARLDRLDENLIKLRDSCIEYYTDASKGLELSTQIKVVTEDIRRESQLIAGKFFKEFEVAKMNQLLVEVVNSATSGSFESKTRVALTKYDMQLTKLFQASAKLVTLFEDKFFSVYPPDFSAP